MKDLIKKLIPKLPRFISAFLLSVYEFKARWHSLRELKKEGKKIFQKNSGNNKKVNVLFYHPSGLSFGGTEKFLQIIAKHLDKKIFEVYFMYSDKSTSSAGVSSDARREYLENQGINFLKFSYDRVEPKFPYYLFGQTPTIFEAINENNIDLVISAGPGYCDYPLNLVKRPILLINIFGSITQDRHIMKHICISKEVAAKIEAVTLKNKIKVFPILSDGPLPDSVNRGRELRERLGISEKTLLFGRIGRSSDSIFDPIGIKAFAKLVKEKNDVAYLIMSPPPILREIVKTEKIDQVYFLEPSSQEEDIWAFHCAIDVLAHFRYDGESFGLNIVESMLAGKPIISHRSTIWNAHTEYLDSSFSRLADIGDIEAYYGFMKEMLVLKESGAINELGKAAKAKAEKLFLAKNRIKEFETLINEAL